MIDIINNDSNYTIISTQVQYGQVIRTCKQEDVRNECERIRKLYEFSAKNNDNKTHSIIEVVNNETGEIREYWNSEQNKVLF